jgi:uncharacterized surface protein with fasciclin (FAS1) repeats
MQTHQFYNFKRLFTSIVFVAILASNSIITLASQVPVNQNPQDNIIQTTSSNPEFSTLVTAIKTASLVDTLSGSGSFTVFAPNNQAFAKLPANVSKKLFLPENKSVLSKILTYHVVSGYLASTDLSRAMTIKTVETSTIAVSVVDNKVKLNNNSTIITSDTKASNGIIHSIDTVLLPANLDLNTLSSGNNTNNSVPSSVTTIVEDVSGTVRTGGNSFNYPLVVLLIIIGIFYLTKDKSVLKR